MSISNVGLLYFINFYYFFWGRETDSEIIILQKKKKAAKLNKVKEMPGQRPILDILCKIKSFSNTEIQMGNLKQMLLFI